MLKNIDGKLVYIGYTSEKPDYVWNGREVPSWCTVPNCAVCIYDALTSGCEALCRAKECYSSALSDD